MSASPTPLAAASPVANEPTVLRETGLRLGGVRARVRRGIVCEAAGVVLAMLVGYALVTFALDRQLRLEVPVRGLLLAVFVWFVGRSLWRRLVRPMRVQLDDEELALAVERRSPQLQQALISSMQFERALTADVQPVESPVLMREVVADVQRRLATLPFLAVLDAERTRRFGALAATCGLLFAGWGVVDGGSLRLWALRNLGLSSIEWPRFTSLTFLGTDGGRVRLPQGDPFTVRVGIAGPIPDQVFLRSEFGRGQVVDEAMSRTGDGEYTLTLETVLENGVLTARGGDGLSAPLHLEIVERPRIDEVTIRIEFPEYMHKDLETVPVTEGEIRLVRGSRLLLSGRSHKPLVEAFALLGDRKLALTLGDERQSFHGDVTPQAGGLLVLDVIDRDQLGAGAPPKLLVRLVEDKAPTLDFRLRGISSIVTTQVRIPGDLKVKDDFGITAVAAGVRAIDDAPERQPQRKPDEAAPEVPFGPIDAVFGDSLHGGATRYETTASLDIRQLNRNPEKEDDPGNTVRPGMLLSLRFAAKDNFGPGEPHEAFGETMSFRVVTREKLVDELRRRQVEQRQEVERIRDEEQQALLSLRDNPRAEQARAWFKGLAARQQALGRRVAFAADLYQRILWEYENNRVWEPAKVREYEGLTAVPLAALATEPFPATAHAVGTFADSGDEELRTSAVQGYTDILARLDAIIKVMEQVETLAALIEQLRGVIKVEDTAIREVERRLKEAGESVFGTKPGGDPKPDAGDKNKK